jgi:hypothetical protein
MPWIYCCTGRVRFSKQWLWRPQLNVPVVDSLVPSRADQIVDNLREQSLCLRLLTGTRSQQAALVQALRPVVKEFVPHLGAAGIEVRSIALLPTLTATAGEPLQAQVERADGTHSFTIRLACSVGGILRRPEDVAGALAEYVAAAEEAAQARRTSPHGMMGAARIVDGNDR